MSLGCPTVSFLVPGFPVVSSLLLGHQALVTICWCQNCYRSGEGLVVLGREI